MQDSLDFDYVFKYILVGDTSVGKSSLLATYNNNEFSSASNPTMGVEFATKKVEMNGHTIKLQIWDTVSTHLFRQARSPSVQSREPTTRTPSESSSSTT